MSPRVLWLTGELPYPTDSGLRQYSLGCARALATAGAEVVGLCLESGGVAAEDGIDWRIVPGSRAGGARALLGVDPVMARAFATEPHRRALTELLATGPWDAAVLHHLQTGWALPDLVAARRRGAVRRIVHMSQNHETSVRLDVARQHRGNVARSAALWLDAWKVRRLERRVAQASDVVVAISDDDAALFRRDVPGTPCVVLTPGYSGRRVPDRVLTDAVPRRAVIVGNLLWHVKRMNLRRFVDVADPIFAAAGVELVVSGAVDADFVAELEPHLHATTFHGAVSTLDADLASARIGIVAEPAGGGFKLKSLDYIFHGVPMAVTAGSVAGLPLVAGASMLEFPDELSLARGIVEHIDDLAALNRIQRAAYVASEPHFDWGSRGATLLDLIAQ